MEIMKHQCNEQHSDSTILTKMLRIRSYYCVIEIATKFHVRAKFSKKGCVVHVDPIIQLDLLCNIIYKINNLDYIPENFAW